MDRYLLSIAFTITLYFKTFQVHSYSIGGIQAFRKELLITKENNIARFDTSLFCINRIAKPAPKPTSESYDTDTSWHTPPTNIVPITIEKYNVRPELITFDAVDVLIEPSQSIGRWYREVLNKQCDMRIRLPRPALFTAAFKKAYSDMCKESPCFGATSGLSARDWWFEVVKRTYKTTQDLNQIEPEEMDILLPKVFNILYDNVFGTKDGWVLKEDTTYTLEKLRDWRDIGAGPKLGIISNFDDRLHNVLSELGIGSYFDFVLTAHECKSEKPDRAIFDIAIQRAGATNASLAFHIGDNVDTDVAGAVAAGWNPLRYNEWFDEGFSDWFDYDTKATAAAGQKKRVDMLKWGRRDTEKELEWVELWGLDDVLTMFGFPDDEERYVKTTMIRGMTDDATY